MALAGHIFCPLVEHTGLDLTTDIRYLEPFWTFNVADNYVLGPSGEHLRSGNKRPDGVSQIYTAESSPYVSSRTLQVATTWN